MRFDVHFKDVEIKIQRGIVIDSMMVSPLALELFCGFDHLPVSH